MDVKAASVVSGISSYSQHIMFQFHISLGEVSCKRFCGGDGLCQGVLLHTEASQSVKVCQDTCTDYDGCNFYSFDPESEQCRMFDSCQTSDLWVNKCRASQNMHLSYRWKGKILCISGEQTCKANLYMY